MTEEISSKNTKKDKEAIKQALIESLMNEKEIKKIILFGSYVNSDNPGDVDIAIIQDSNQTYLNLAMKYRRLTRNISRQIPIDIIPIKDDSTKDNWFLSEINKGELIYER